MHISKDSADRPKEVFRCRVQGCDQSFVRLDLCKRHQTRHEETLTASAQAEPVTVNTTAPDTATGHASESSQFPSQQATLVDWQTNGQHSLQEPAVTNTPQTTHIELGAQPQIWLPDELPQNMPQDTFVSWLFDSPGSQQQNFDLSNYLPNVDFGMDYCSPLNDLWNVDTNQTVVNFSATAPLAVPQMRGASHEVPFASVSIGAASISTDCRSRIVHKINSFIEKKLPPGIQDAVVQEGLLSSPDGRDRPHITTTILQHCISNFWIYGAVSVPIIHRPTFSNDDCETLLLLAMIMLGAGQIARSNTNGLRDDYRALADLIAIHLRWEIFPEAEPPIKLWIAQSLLLLEFYEKMFSTRRLHERAYTHHASTLALLRRGSPMVGHAEGETSSPPTRCITPEPGVQQNYGTSKQATWWHRWARNESWHRVVFSALQMDTLHAVLFGHESVLLPYEIRLPLPCDDSLWSAKSPEDARRLEETFSMHGILKQPFLDSLKRCLHGHEVHSHHEARFTLGAGLLSVGWHIKRRERHQQFLDTIPSAQEQERWRILLLQAYENWCQSFQKALEKSGVSSRNAEDARRNTSDPRVILRIAYITTHIDILDAQVFAGSKRLLGRRVTENDYAKCSTRMRLWALNPPSKLAVIHAFKLLDETLLGPNVRAEEGLSNIPLSSQYTCRADPSPYRPWALYLAGLTIWSYQYTLITRGSQTRRQIALDPATVQNTAFEYIRRCNMAGNIELGDQMPAQGCAAICKILSDDFANAEWELLLEASRILDSCTKVISGVPA